MARIIVKATYLKPTKKRTPGKYARYVATRDGVAKIDDSYKYHEPRSRDTTYADYIATRPRAEKMGKHGLFTDAGVEVDLDKVAEELNNFKGTIWTIIVSIRREDAEMTGFDIGERWRNMVRANRDELANSFKIRPSSMQWYGAYHNESYHPHIHLIVYDKENRGYLDKKGIEKIKSDFAHVIFQDEMLNIQNEKTERRNRLREVGKDEIEAIASRISDGGENNIVLRAMLMDLHERLKRHKGKKVYGYLKQSDRALVKNIVDQIESIPAVKELYSLWYDKQEELRRMYSETLIPRVALSENPEFKTIRNAVVQTAIEISHPNDTDLDMGIVGLDLNSNNSHELNMHAVASSKLADTLYIATSVTRLLNSAGKVFVGKFSDNPKHVEHTEHKLRIKMLEKDQSHGIKHII